MAVSGSSRDRNGMASRGRALNSGKIMDLKSHCGPLLIVNSQVNDVEAHGQLLLRMWRVRGNSLLQASFDLIVQNSEEFSKDTLSCCYWEQWCNYQPLRNEKRCFWQVSFECDRLPRSKLVCWLLRSLIKTCQWLW